jgi:hypothetical protein
MGDTVPFCKLAEAFSPVSLSKLQPNRWWQLPIRPWRDSQVERCQHWEDVNRKVAGATPGGFEPPISTVTGWHVRPLHHGAILAH